MLITSPQFPISDVISHLNEILSIIEDSSCEFNIDYCFKIFLNILVNIPNIEIVKKTLVVMKYFIFSSHEASRQLFKLQIFPILILFLQQIDNNFIRRTIFSIFSNLLKEGEEIFYACIECRFVELYVNEFQRLLNALNLSDFHSFTLLDPVIDGLLSLSQYPTPYSQQLIHMYSSILSNRQNLGMFVDNTLSYSKNLMVNPIFDNTIFFTSGFVSNILEILCDDYSVYWTNSYLCLGQILKDQTQEAYNLINGFDLVSCCAKALSFQDLDTFAQGLFFFVSNFIDKKMVLIPELEKLNLFNWEYLQFRIVSYKSTKSFAYMIITVLYYSNLEQVINIISNDATVNVLFDCLDNAKINMIIKALIAFEQLETKFKDKIRQFPLFLERLAIFLENVTNDANEEVAGKALMLRHALEID